MPLFFLRPKGASSGRSFAQRKHTRPLHKEFRFGQGKEIDFMNKYFTANNLVC
jgi:hypothetical protein